MRSLKLALVVLLVLLTPALLKAQGVQSGSVSGTIVDPSQAVIPGAQVVLANVATGLTRTMTTDARGYFYFAELPAGVYRLTVTQEGFRAYHLSDLDVRTGKETGLGSIPLEVGPVAETVEVEASTEPLVETSSAQIQGTFSGRQVQTLRRGFAGIDSIAILTPGVIPGFGNINSNGMQVAANGQRSRSTQFTIDGHEINDITLGGPLFFVGNLDMVAEYQVVTNQFSAEYGRNLGATVTIITKGGSNDIHGKVFYLHQNNSALNATTSRESQTGIRKRPKLLVHDWGFTIGGPAIRNKLFWYGSYNGTKSPGSTNLIGTFGSNRVITPAGITTLENAGFGSSLPLQIYKTRGPMAIPDGNPTCVPGTTTTQAVAGVAGVEVCAAQRGLPLNTDFWEYNVRGDYTSGKDSLFARYFIQNNEFCCSGGLSGYWIAIPNRNESLAATYTRQISPRITNELRFAYGKLGVSFEGGNTEPISNVGANLTNISLGAPWVGFGLATNLPQNRFVKNYQVQNNLVWARGRHIIKAGVEIRHNRTTLFFLPFINGSFGFRTCAAGTGGPPPDGPCSAVTPEPLTTFFNNQPDSVSFTAGNGSFDPIETDQFYYLQNDIRLKPNLTLNLGLRYEFTGQAINRAVDEVLARESDPNTAFWLQTVPLDQRTLPRIPNDTDNWAPRIGFAYTPRIAKWLFGEDRTVIRGGYGIAHEIGFYNILLNVTTAAPRVFAFSLTRRAGTTIPIPGSGLGSDVATTIPVPTNTFDPRRSFQTTVAPDFHSPYGQNWSLGIQRHVGRTHVVEARYVGTNSIGQFQSRNANPRFRNLALGFTSPALPGFTFPAHPEAFPAGFTPCADTTAAGFGRLDCTRAGVRERLNAARSNYHSLQTRWDVRNWGKQFTGGIAYTWSKGIDNSSEIFGFFGAGSIAFSENPLDIIKGERGVSNHNLAQTFAAHYIWDLPWLREQRGVLGKILGGWSISGITTALSGRPWTPIQLSGNGYCTEDTAFNAPFAGLFSTCRPFLANPNAPVNTVGFVTTTGQIRLGGTAETNPLVTINDVRFIHNDNNAIRFVFPGSAFGVGRNNFRGDNTVNFDIGIDKNVKITEDVTVAYRLSMVNAFNHRNFGVPTIRADLGDFGIPQRENVAGRIIRMMLSVSF